MITNFENFTSELNEFEVNNILPYIVDSWKRKIPDVDVINMKDMVAGLNSYLFKNKIGYFRKNNFYKIYKMNEPRMRKFIHHIRVSGIVPNLIATSKGYFLTNKKNEIQKFINSCRERANSFDEVADAMIIHNQIH